MCCLNSREYVNDDRCSAFLLLGSLLAHNKLPMSGANRGTSLPPERPQLLLLIPSEIEKCLGIYIRVALLILLFLRIPHSRILHWVFSWGDTAKRMAAMAQGSSPSNVDCTICLEEVSDSRGRTAVTLRCGHTFHLGELNS